MYNDCIISQHSKNQKKNPVFFMDSFIEIGDSNRLTKGKKYTG